MKRLAVCMFLALTYMLSPVISQANSSEVVTVPYSGASKSFAIMVNDPGLFKAAVSTAQQLDIKKNSFNYEIVIVGSLAKDIVEDASLKESIDQATSMGAKISVCNAALNKFKVEKSKLDKRISIVPNGYIHMFELQDRKYNTLMPSK